MRQAGADIAHMEFDPSTPTKTFRMLETWLVSSTTCPPQWAFSMLVAGSQFWTWSVGEQPWLHFHLLALRTYGFSETFSMPHLNPAVLQSGVFLCPLSEGPGPQFCLSTTEVHQVSHQQRTDKPDGGVHLVVILCECASTRGSAQAEKFRRSLK